MCEHNHSEIKFCKRDDGLEPVLYCNDCTIFLNEYSPRYEHSFFTHGTVYDLKQFLSDGTDKEQKEKINSLTYGLKSILEHYTCCDCGYDENYTFIFGQFINEFRLLEYYFLKKSAPDIDPKDIKNHLRLFPRWLLDKVKVNKNNWTSQFRMKYNIYATTDYNEMYYGNTNR
jgi:inhibitor of KinA sporulation pathway (predicted exonuclease)